MAEKTAAFSIPVDSNATQVGTEGAAALEQLRQKIAGSTDAIRQMSATLRSLRGSTDEVKAAKSQLSAQIEAEKGAISSANLSLVKQGSSYAKLADQTKEAEKAQKKFQEELEKKKLEEMKKEVDALKQGLASTGDPIGDLKNAFGSAEGVMALTVGAVAAVVAALGALAGALAYATAATVRWIIEGANLNRTLSLQREAWTGSATNAEHLGHQIDALALKVPTAKEKLNELAGELVKALNNSRVSGQGIVDTFNAVAQASSAMGDEVGNTLAEIIKAGKMSGRVAIVAPQLQGTGLKVQDIGAELAKMMHVSVGEAVQALAQGRVKVDDAAEAIRKAVEKRFGEINARKMLDLDVIAQKLRESFSALTKDVHIEPLLEGFKQLADLVSQSSVSGKALHDVITVLGNKLGPAFKEVVPVIRKAFLEVEIGAAKVIIAVLKARLAIKQAFAGHEDILTTADAVKVLTGFIDGLAAAAVFTVRVLTTGFILASKVFFFLDDAAAKVKQTLGVGWKELGVSIVDGLTFGLFSKMTGLQSAGDAMAAKLKDAFTAALGIHSPSAVFEGYGKNTAEGYQKGLEGGAEGAQGAAGELAPEAPPAPAGAGGGPGGRGSIQVVVNLNVGAGAQAQATAKAVQGVLPDLVKALQDALQGAGVPVQQEVTT